MSRYGIIRKINGFDVLSPWLTADEAGAYCGQSGEWVRERVRRGLLVPDRPTESGKMMFLTQTLDDFLRAGGSRATVGLAPASGDARREDELDKDKGSRDLSTRYDSREMEGYRDRTGSGDQEDDLPAQDARRLDDAGCPRLEGRGEGADDPGGVAGRRHNSAQLDQLFRRRLGR